MIVSDTTRDLVTRGGCRKMLLPFERGREGELLPCGLAGREEERPARKAQGLPNGRGLVFEQGVEFKFSSGVPFAKGIAATVLSVNRATVAQARGAIQPLGRVRGEGWLVVFVLGEHGEIFRKHAERYLSAKGVGLTFDPSKAARGEPAVTTEADLKNAAAAEYKRALEDEQRWRAARAQMQTAIAALRAAGGDPADVAFLERRLAKMDRCRSEQRAA